MLIMRHHSLDYAICAYDAPDLLSKSYEGLPFEEELPFCSIIDHIWVWSRVQTSHLIWWCWRWWKKWKHTSYGTRPYHMILSDTMDLFFDLASWYIEVYVPRGKARRIMFIGLFWACWSTRKGVADYLKTWKWSCVILLVWHCQISSIRHLAWLGVWGGVDFCFPPQHVWGN